MCIEIRDLTKAYAAVVALRNCTLTVGHGEILGLLGPNGSGKTTLLRLLLGFLRPTSGTATVDGLDTYRESVRVHQRLAYLPGEVRLYRRQRGDELLRLLSALRGSTSYARAVEMAGQLKLDLTRPIATMSTGMRQKLALVATFAVNVPWLLLDEPTSALDPNARRTIAGFIRRTREEGKTVLLSSHILSEVEEVCDRVVVMREGFLVHTQIMEELKGTHQIQCRLREHTLELPSALRSQVDVRTAPSGKLTIETSGDLSPVLNWLANAKVEEIRVEPVGLKSIYDHFHPTE